MIYRTKDKNSLQNQDGIIEVNLKRFKGHKELKKIKKIIFLILVIRSNNLRVKSLKIRVNFYKLILNIN